MNQSKTPIMTRLRKILKVDTFIQGLVLASITLLALVSLITQQGFLVFSLLGLIFLGIWQVLSALVIGFGFSQKNRVQYLLLSMLYLAGMIGLMSLASYWSVDWLRQLTFTLGLLLIPYGIGWWYFFQSYTDLHVRLKVPRSFWDI